MLCFAGRLPELDSVLAVSVQIEELIEELADKKDEAWNRLKLHREKLLSMPA